MKPSQKIILIVGIFFLATASPVLSSSISKKTFNTSFDCAKAKSNVEITICENKEVAEADMEMDVIYKSLMSSLPDSDKNRLKHEQRDWLKTRSLCGSSKVVLDCIKNVYAKRNDVLKKKQETIDSHSADDNFPYSKECAQYHLKRSTVLIQDAAQGVGEREPYEEKGMALHEKGLWKDSNCFLIHAANISQDHALNLINTIGFNYAALGDDKQALAYFEDATGYEFDLDNWLKHKAKPPFNKILNKPLYKRHEQLLYRYYKDMGLEIPKY